MQGPDRDGGEFLPAVTEGEPSGQSPEASADRSFISVRASSGMPYLHQLRASLVFKCRSIPVSLQASHDWHLRHLWAGQIKCVTCLGSAWLLQNAIDSSAKYMMQNEVIGVPRPSTASIVTFLCVEAKHHLAVDPREFLLCIR